jgi:iron complex transport system substrate-binding protein
MFKSLRLVLSLLASALALTVVSASPGGATGAGPRCVVSLSPTATETLFAIGAGAQVQAVDKDSNYPATGLPGKRIDALNPSVESIIGICKTSASHPSTKPDVVFISYDANSIKAKLTAVGIKVVEQDAPTTVAGAYGQIIQLGRLTGHLTSAKSLVASLKKTIASDIKSIPAHPGKTLTAYYELDPTYYSITSSTFVGSLLKSLGVVNIADAKSTSADAGYPQLSAEYIVSSNPKMIFLADTVCCQASAATVATRPGFSTVNAVANGEVIALNDDVASRWGPRLKVLMNQITRAVKNALGNSALWQ